jgi:hypothetical protein
MSARLAAALATAVVASLASTGAWASPCAVPGDYLRAGSGQEQRQPLVRPYVIEGLAVTALHQREGQLWLELAVDSESTARRALAAPGSEVHKLSAGAVLVSCRGLPAGAQRRVALAQPALW